MSRGARGLRRLLLASLLSSTAVSAAHAADEATAVPANDAGTTIIGAVRRPRAGSLPSATTSTPAPAFIAAVAKSCPSIASPLMAKKASPRFKVRLSMEMPVMPAGMAPIGRPSMAATSASEVGTQTTSLPSCPTEGS